MAGWRPGSRESTDGIGLWRFASDCGAGNAPRARRTYLADYSRCARGFLRIFRSEPIEWKDRAHFYAVAAQQLRRVLLDHARRAHSEKRGGEIVKVSLWESDAGTLGVDERLLALDEALARLESLDPRAARVVELRFFGGLTEGDAAEALGISVASLKRDWDFAKTWLASQLA